MTNDGERSSQQSLQIQETGLNVKANSLGQHWSQGQCNIVDHRKLVLVINNDKNKQRWVSEQDSNKNKWGFPTAAQGSLGFSRAKTWKKPSRLPEFLSMHIIGLAGRKRNCNHAPFVLLFMNTSVHWGAYRWIEGVSRVCDCSLTVTPCSVSVCGIYRAE